MRPDESSPALALITLLMNAIGPFLHIPFSTPSASMLYCDSSCSRNEQVLCSSVHTGASSAFHLWFHDGTAQFEIGAGPDPALCGSVSLNRYFSRSKDAGARMEKVYLDDKLWAVIMQRNCQIEEGDAMTLFERIGGEPAVRLAVRSVFLSISSCATIPPIARPPLFCQFSVLPFLFPSPLIFPLRS